MLYFACAGAAFDRSGKRIRAQQQLYPTNRAGFKRANTGISLQRAMSCEERQDAVSMACSVRNTSFIHTRPPLRRQLHPHPNRRHEISTQRHFRLLRCRVSPRATVAMSPTHAC